MLRELNEYLRGDMSDDYWYDDALFICEDVLKAFSDNQWKELLNSISNENTRWKIRLAECIGGIGNVFELQCILKMINVDNEDLFVACVDSLRRMDMSTMNELTKKKIQKQIKLRMEQNSLPVTKIFEEFLKK